MGLNASELIRLKIELGFAGLTVQAEPYISYVSLFDQIVQPFLEAGAETTSSTAVTASTSPAQVALTLVSATGFSSMARAVVDVDSAQETATVQSVSGNIVTLLLTKTHGPGAYPVSVEGGASMVRDYLRQIAAKKLEIEDAGGTGAVKQVDEVSFYPTRDQTLFANLYRELMVLRRELASVIGFVTAWDVRAGGSTRSSVY